MLASQEIGAGHSDQTEAIVPTFARVQLRLASSDDGSERTFRGRDNLESWSFSFQSTYCRGAHAVDCRSSIELLPRLLLQ